MPINHSYRSKINVYSRDGESRTDGNSSGAVNYEPNTLGGPVADPKWAKAPIKLSGDSANRYNYTHPNDDFQQIRNFWNNVLTEEDKEHLVNNIAGHLGNAKQEL